jgi:hypothetical protein
MKADFNTQVKENFPEGQGGEKPVFELELLIRHAQGCLKNQVTLNERLG